MTVVCSGCGARYKIDPEKIKGPRAWFKCRRCGTAVQVDLPAGLPDEGPDQVLDALDALVSQLPESPTAPVPPEDHQTLAGDREAGTDPLESSASPKPAVSVRETKKQKYRFGLTDKVIFFMLMVSLLPGGIFFALSSKSSHERIMAQTNRTGKLVIDQLVSRVDGWVDKNVRVLNSFSRLSDIAAMDPGAQTAALKALQEEYPWIYLAFTTDVRGQNIARSDGKPLTDYSDRQYVRDVAGGKALAWQTLIGKTSKKPALILAVPIKQGYVTVGVLAAAMTRDDISEGVTNLRLGKTGASFLVDETGRAVAHQNNAFVLSQHRMSGHPLVEAARSGDQEGMGFEDLDGTERIGFTRKTRLGWTLAIQQGREEALAPLSAARTQALILLALTLILVLLIAVVATRTIVRPIRELTEAADRISVGDLDVEIKVASKDEIGDLAAAVTRLQDSVQMSISRLRRMRQ